MENSNIINKVTKNFELMNNQIKSNQIKSNQIKSNQIKSNQIQNLSPRYSLYSRSLTELQGR